MIAPAANAMTSASRTARIRSGTAIARIIVGSEDAAHRPAGAGEDFGISPELEAVARSRRECVELEGDVGRISVGGQVAGLDRNGGLAPQRFEPALHDLRDLVAQRTGAGVELHGGGREEAAARHHLALVVAEPALAEGEQLR